MVLSYILGGATFGFLGRMYAMGIMQRPFFESVGGYLAYMSIGAAGGYWYKGFKQDQRTIAERRYETLLAYRAEREAQLEAEQQ
ncbi:hypothetical protein IWQ61_004120 [Dispira simplex]|nr:hypothetical protein IWQ61_004120 [Dispira simplex]